MEKDNQAKNCVKSVSDLARKTGHPLAYVSWAIGLGFVPSPDVVIPGRKKMVYSNYQFRKACHSLTDWKHQLPPDTYSCGKCAAKLGLSGYKFSKLVKAGLLPKPDYHVGKRFYYSAKQYEQLQQTDFDQLGDKVSKIPDGYFTGSGAADYLGVPRITLQSWQIKEHIPKPTRKTDYYLPLYDLADLDKIQKLKAEYFKLRRLT